MFFFLIMEIDDDIRPPSLRRPCVPPIGQSPQRRPRKLTLDELLAQPKKDGPDVDKQ